MIDNKIQDTAWYGMVPPKKEGRRRIEGDRIKDVTRILVKKTGQRGEER